MRPATLRRLLVFGVCASGVVALYAAPSLSRPRVTAGQPAIGLVPTPVGTTYAPALPHPSTARTPASGSPLDAAHRLESEAEPAPSRLVAVEDRRSRPAPLRNVR